VFGGKKPVNFIEEELNRLNEQPSEKPASERPPDRGDRSGQRSAEVEPSFGRRGDDEIGSSSDRFQGPILQNPISAEN
jgi:hypothetical protein